MKSKAPLLVLIGAAFFGLLAAVTVSSYLRNWNSNTKLNAIVVARMEIPLGGKILAEQLTTVQMPLNATPEGSFNQVAEVAGRVAATRILARETITAARLASMGATAGLSAVIPEGMRAMTVKVEDDSGISGFALPGTVVDVAAVIKVNSQQDSISKIILQNIKVLANGGNLDEPEDKRDAQKARTVTLLVSPDQAEKLLLASADGSLRLVMRNGADQSNQATQGASVRSLLTGEGGLTVADLMVRQTAPAAQAAPARRVVRNEPAVKTVAQVAPSAPPAKVPPRNEVEIIEGMKKRTVEFP